MGWLFQYGQTLKEMIARRTKGWETRQTDGTLVKTTCLRHCYRGGAFSGVLWTVYERTFTRHGQQVEPTERWIGCDILKYQRDFGWGYKDMEESMGPYQYSCPLGYLAMVPVACQQWRDGVRLYHERLKARRKAKRVSQSC